MTAPSLPGDGRPSTTMRADGGRGVVHVEDTYSTGPEDLWAAVTEPDRLRRWLGDVEGDLRAGGRFRARFRSSWEGDGLVEVCDPPTFLRVRLDPGLPEETVVEARLSRRGDGTHLVVEERGLPLDGIHHYGAGWQVHAEDLSAHLLGRPQSSWRERWTDLSPAYRAMADELRDAVHTT